MSATIDSVTTHDGAPTTAPHKISNQSGKDSADVLFTPGRTIVAYEIRNGGSTINTGTLVEKAGRLVCGRFKCGARRLSSFSSSAQQAVNITYAESGGGADGSRTINVWIKSSDAAFD